MEIEGPKGGWTSWWRAGRSHDNAKDEGIDSDEKIFTGPSHRPGGSRGRRPGSVFVVSRIIEARESVLSFKAVHPGPWNPHSTKVVGQGGDTHRQSHTD